MTIQLFELVGRDDRRFSPYCWRTRMALEHKGLAYETIPTRFTDKDLISFSGQERVPVIRDGDTVVSDSWAIAEYLEEQYSDAPSLFGGATGHGLAKFLNVWTDRTLHLALIKLVIADILDHTDPADHAYFNESRAARLGETPARIQTRSEEDVKAFRAAVATGKSQRGADRVIEEFGFSDRFEVVLGGNSVSKPKPNPDLLFSIMEKTGTKDIVMIGDTTYDLEMAHAAGVKGIGVSWGHHTSEELSKWAPVVDSVEELGFD